MVIKMNVKEREEFAVMKNEISHIKYDVEEIKQMLIEHTKWEETKYSELDKKYAPISTQTIAIGSFLTALGIIVTLIIMVV